MAETSNLRYELKLTCGAQFLSQARSWIRLHPAGFRSAYPTRQVNSLYFDTPQLHSYHGNLAGHSGRQKLRLRWYGERLTQITAPTLELKLKENLVGDKKQQKLDCTLDLSQPYAKSLPIIRSAAPAEWQPRLAVASQPTLINSYQRSYFTTPDQRVRVTLDYGQVAFGQRTAIRPNLNRPLLGQDLVVIEIKGPPEESDRLEKIINHFPISRSRNSKYVNGMQAQWF